MDGGSDLNFYNLIKKLFFNKNLLIILSHKNRDFGKHMSFTVNR